MDSASPAIVVRDLRKVYGNKAAVDGLNLTVPRGCFFGFLGPNGAGKSTTIRMLTGLIPPTSGLIELLGMPMPAQALEIKKSAKIGILLGLQNSEHFRRPEDVDFFRGLGQRVSQLTYNARNLIGNGSTPSGTVAFKASGTVISNCSAIAASNGQATCTTTALAAGSYQITGTYSGDSTYSAGIAGPITQTVK